MNARTAAPEKPASPIKVVAAVFGVVIAGSGVAIGLFLWALAAMRAHHVATAWVMAAAFVYGVVILGVALGAARIGQRLSRMRPNPAQRRYQTRFMIAMGAYVFTLLAVIGAFIGGHPPTWLAWPLALAPAVPVVGAIVVMGLYLREETDELERVIASECALWATGALLAIATIWGFLEEFGLVIHVVAWAVFPIWAVCLGIANAIVRRRYQ